MGIYDRDYTRAGPADAGHQVQYRLPPITLAVKWLLIVNVAVFLFEAISGEMDKGSGSVFVTWGAIWPQSWVEVVQVWRLVTYQFMHAGLLHLVLNMMALFFLGPRLERYWGSRKFVGFYLLCGIMGGLIYTLTALVGILPKMPLVGASGAILGILAACAILFPADRIILIIFPMPIRVAAVILTAIFILLSLTGDNRGGNVAHLGGMATGALYVWLGSRLSSRISERRRGAWDKRMERQRRLQIEVDRLLDKVHEHGLGSLTRQEKKLLQEATKLEQERRRNSEID